MKSILNYLLLLLLIFYIFSCKTNSIEPDISEELPSPPECLVKSYNFYLRGDGIAFGGEETLSYNADGKVILKNGNYSHKEDKSNLGSDINPYVTEYSIDTSWSLSCTKYYCDINGKVKREEYFSSSKNKYPYSIGYEEYNDKGYNIKTTSKYVNDSTGKFTGDYNIIEAEYIDGNFSKMYRSYKKNNIFYTRSLIREYIYSTVPVKTKILYLFNYGIKSFSANNKFYPSRKINYKLDGSIEKQGEYVYEFDNKGYLLSSKIKYSDKTEDYYYDYVYQCK
jgi:hypothetical protein